MLEATKTTKRQRNDARESVSPWRAVGSGFLVRIALLVMLWFVSSAQAQQPVPGKKGVAPVRAVVNFQELAAREAASPPAPPERRVAPFGRIPGDLPVPPEAGQPKAPEPPTAAIGLPIVSLASPTPLASFQALGDSDSNIPPDTHGAAGTTFLMVTLNSQVRIMTRSGSPFSTVTLNSFWTSTGATGVFDPRVVFDPFNDRWILAAVSDAKTANSSLLIGASQSGDPRGTWNLYRIDADAANQNFADFPSLGFNKDWVVVTVNLFSNVGETLQGSSVYAFKKADLYAGVGANFTLFSDPNSAPAPAATYDNTLATMYLVRNWNGNSMNRGRLRISSITGSVGAETYTADGPFVTTMNTWAFEPPNGSDFAPQQGTSDKIQSNDARIQNVVYRNGSLWTAQTAFLPANGPTRDAAQWWQFLPDGTLQQFGRVDDPNGVFFYAFPSIAVNSQNDMLLGYSSFSATQFASASYSIRASTDPANTLRSDTLLKAGEATYFKTFGGTENRWGDYSATVVDPVNDLDFWTIQEYASSPDFPNGDDRWGTWWGKISLNPPRRRGQLISE